jgi:isopentenyl phosphate kinase
LKFQNLGKQPIVLKLGGSVITFKNEEQKANVEAVKRLADEIVEANPKRLLIIHGGGSFGHPQAKKHGIFRGYKGKKEQLLGFSETRISMLKLNSLIVKSLNEAGLPAVGLQTSALAVNRAGKISRLNMEPILGVLKLGGIPVLYGDAALDLDWGFSICSGDDLVSTLALKLKSPLAIIGVDVDGIYTADPKISSEAKLIEKINIESKEFRKLLRSLKGSEAIDVTGGMRRKILEIKRYVAGGGKALIINALKPGNVKLALRGGKVRGTLVYKS